MINVCCSDSFKDTYLQSCASDEMIYLPLHLSMGNLHKFWDCNYFATKNENPPSFSNSDSQTIETILDEIAQSNQAITIWVSTSYAWDKCNYLFLVSALFEMELYVIDPSSVYAEHPELKTDNNDMLDNLDIDDIRFLKKHRHFLTKEEKENCILSWEKLLKNNTCLRIIKNREIASVSESYYDRIILKYVSKEKKRAVFTVAGLYADIGYIECDSFIYSRLISMLRHNKIHSDDRSSITPKTMIWKEN